MYTYERCETHNAMKFLKRFSFAFAQMLFCMILFRFSACVSIHLATALRTVRFYARYAVSFIRLDIPHANSFYSVKINDKIFRFLFVSFVWRFCQMKIRRKKRLSVYCCFFTFECVIDSGHFLVETGLRNEWVLVTCTQPKTETMATTEEVDFVDCFHLVECF